MHRANLALMLALVAASASHAQVINEIHYDPASGSAGDANADGIRDALDDEFVEIVNDTGSSLDISGWTINDAVAARHTFPASTVLGPNAGIVVFGGGVPTGLFGGSLVQTASTGTLSLNNTGDTVSLMNGMTVEDSHMYDGSVSGESIVRSPEFTGSFVAHSSVSGLAFSPGTRVDGTNLPVELLSFTIETAASSPPTRLASFSIQ